jgi:hypothetical protein
VLTARVGCRLALIAGLLGVLLGQMLRAQTSPATLPDLKLSKAGRVNAIVVQPDGKMIVGGRFTAVNDVPRNNLARLNPNGSVDLTWNPPTLYFDRGFGVKALVLIGPNLFVAGDGLAKVLGNGELDATWRPALVDLRSMAVSGTDLFVGGNNVLAKVSTTGSGTINPSWNPNPSGLGSIKAIIVNDTNVFVGGMFTSIGGLNRNSLAKLSAQTGLADPVWNPLLGEGSDRGFEPVATMAQRRC